MKWRVDAQVLYTRTFEAESEDEACEKMDELLQDCDYRDFDWSIGANKTCCGCKYKTTNGGEWCYKLARDIIYACKDYESEDKIDV